MEGYRNISKHVNANPDWWLFGDFDGFGAYMASERAMKLRYEAKIVMGKEDGDISHIFQAYDDQVANMDKSSSGESISALNNISFLYKGLVDQIL